MDKNTESTGFEVNENKSFNQEEVNQIIGGRLAGMKKQAQKQVEEEYAQKLKELEAREKRLNALEKLRASSLPDDLTDILVNSSDLDKSIETLKKYISNENAQGKKQETGFQVIGAAQGGRQRGDSIAHAMGIRR